MHPTDFDFSANISLKCFRLGGSLSMVNDTNENLLFTKSLYSIVNEKNGSYWIGIVIAQLQICITFANVR